MKTARYELAHNLGFARYVPGSTPLHCLHPGTKLMLILCGLSLLVAVRGPLPLVAALLLICLGIGVAAIPPAIPIRSLLRAMPWLIVVIIVQVFTVRGTHWGVHYGSFWIFHLRGGQLYAAVESLLRFSCLILFLTLAIAVTHVGELAYGVEALLTPLAKYRFPARELSLILTIALYFIPLFAAEADHIVRSQKSRGADFGGGKIRLLQTVRTYVPLFVPLMVLALRHAENLARAMEARGYVVGSRRTRLIVHRLRPLDIVPVILIAAVVPIAILHPLFGSEGWVRGLFQAVPS